MKQDTNTVKIWDVITRRTRVVSRTRDIATCYDCGRSWDDSIPTSMTPAPSARCPFEGMRRLPGYRKLKIIKSIINNKNMGMLNIIEINHKALNRLAKIIRGGGKI